MAFFAVWLTEESGRGVMGYDFFFLLNIFIKEVTEKILVFSYQRLCHFAYII
jgi:hypothetical protein